MSSNRLSKSLWTPDIAGRSAADWPAVAVSFCAALVVLALASLALRTSRPSESVAPAAVVRQIGGGDLEIAAAKLLTIEQLSRALRESRFPAVQGTAEMTLAEAAEQVRPNLRVDIAPGGRGVTPAATIRWIGDPKTPGAVDLLNGLAHRFSDLQRSDRIAAAEQARQTAAAKLREATDAVHTAEQDFQRAMRNAGSGISVAPGGSSATNQDLLEPSAPGPSAASARQAELRSQLAELESQRSVLAERLMPAHPEMRALDAQIALLRAKLADTADLKTTVDAALPPPPAREARPEGAPRDSGIQREWEAVVNARRQYEMAVGEERAAWERLMRCSLGEPVEMIPASPSPPTMPEMSWWKSAASALAAWLAGWLVLVFWPAPTAPLTTAEQVRRATRLPVIALPSLN
ncbi:MAG TPA: hypothetical protein VF306_09650 [Pirellulales bacterium]